MPTAESHPPDANSPSGQVTCLSPTATRHAANPLNKWLSARASYHTHGQLDGCAY